MREKEIETTSGKTNIRMLWALACRAPYPTNTLQQTAIAAIIPQASGGIRFHHAACVYPWEFNTSFMPEMAKAMTGVGCEVAGARTADHSSLCN